MLHKAAEDLVQPFLHHHRSREVRTLTACCIADVFRIFYPDPPYDDDQMKVCNVDDLHVNTCTPIYMHGTCTVYL